MITTRERQVFVRSIVVATVLAGVLLVSGCDANPAGSPSQPPSSPDAAVAITTESVSAAASAPTTSSPTVAGTTPSAMPTPTPAVEPTPAPIGSGSITLDAQSGAAIGDCVVSTSTLAAGPLADDATLTLAATANVGLLAEPVSVRATTVDQITVRVDGVPTTDGARAWSATQVVAGLADAGNDGRAVLTLTARLAPAAPSPTLPVAVATPTPADSASSSTTASDATATPSPTPTPPQRTRPDPVQAPVPTAAPDRLLDMAVECRVTTESR